jgi:hypothetical protein
MSTFLTLKVSNKIILTSKQPFPESIEGFKAIYIVKKTLDTYCRGCAFKFPLKILTVKLAFFEDDCNPKCACCKKRF